MFTELEKTILDATEPQYKYITRDRIGRLFLSPKQPFYYNGEYLYSGESTALNAFASMFKDVKRGGAPICFRKPILDDAERHYLSEVIKPFRKNVVDVAKKTACSDGAREHIVISVNGRKIIFPDFEKNNMYNGMELGKRYTLEELGLKLK